jgi:hypothetical protein
MKTNWIRVTLMDRQQYVSALNQANELGKLAGFTS